MNESKETVSRKFQISFGEKESENVFTHSYYQGLIVEIGNMKNLQTYVPMQDKNKKFLERPLKELAGLRKIHNFTYPNVLRHATTIDVVWFNKRNFPDAFFEVEHSTNILNSLTKFSELQDFFVKFHIVAAPIRKRKFEDIISKAIFLPIKDRVKFVDYTAIVKLHEKMSELAQLGNVI